MHHAFAYADVSEKAVELKARAFSISKEGSIFPVRYVELPSFGENTGYTNVVVFDLEPLEPESPIAHEITPASFRNFGVEYQVYYFRGSGEEVGERYERGATLFSESCESTLRAAAARSSSNMIRISSTRKGSGSWPSSDDSNSATRSARYS